MLSNVAGQRKNTDLQHFFHPPATRLPSTCDTFTALHPHLTLQEVAARSGYNRSYISGIIKAQFGGFFDYVNRLRVERVDAWMQEHPAGTIQEAVEEAGFGSRQSYYSVKSRLEGITRR